jgi:hypothetical protein
VCSHIPCLVPYIRIYYLDLQRPRNGVALVHTPAYSRRELVGLPDGKNMYYQYCEGEQEIHRSYDGNINKGKNIAAYDHGN